MTKYPKLPVEKWVNAKLTLKERGEIDYYVNHAGWSLKRVAEMYHVSQHTARYWSDPEFKRIDNIRAGKRMKRKMENQLKLGDNELNRDGTAKWVKAVHFQRLAMVHEGLLASDSPRGIWAITNQGRRWLSEHQ